MKKILRIEDEKKIRYVDHPLLKLMGVLTGLIFEIDNAIPATSIIIEEKMNIILLDTPFPAIDGIGLKDIIQQNVFRAEVVFPVFFLSNIRKKFIRKPRIATINLTDRGICVKN